MRYKNFNIKSFSSNFVSQRDIELRKGLNCTVHTSFKDRFKNRFIFNKYVTAKFKQTLSYYCVIQLLYKMDSKFYSLLFFMRLIPLIFLYYSLRNEFYYFILLFFIRWISLFCYTLWEGFHYSLLLKFHYSIILLFFMRRCPFFHYSL